MKPKENHHSKLAAQCAAIDSAMDVLITTAAEPHKEWMARKALWEQIHKLMDLELEYIQGEVE